MVSRAKDMLVLAPVRCPDGQPGASAPEEWAGEEWASPAPRGRQSGVNAARKPAARRDGGAAPAWRRDGRGASWLRGRTHTPYGGSNCGTEREEEKRKPRGSEKREGRVLGSRGGAERREAAAGSGSVGPGADSCRSCGREAGSRGQVREPPTAAGRRPPAGRGARLGAPAAAVGAGPYGAAAGPGSCSPPSKGARSAARGSGARRSRHLAGMRNLTIFLLSLCWSLGRVSHPAMIPGPPKRVKLDPPDRGRGDSSGSSRHPRPRSACAEPLRLAVPSQLPPLPEAGGSAQPEQVRRLRRRRRTHFGGPVTPAARAYRLSPGGDLAGERTPHTRRDPQPIASPRSCGQPPWPHRRRRGAQAVEGTAPHPRELLGFRDGSTPAGQSGPGPSLIPGRAR